MLDTLALASRQWPRNLYAYYLARLLLFMLSQIAKGYVHVNQDTLKDFERCLRVAREAINDGKSVVVSLSPLHSYWPYCFLGG